MKRNRGKQQNGKDKRSLQENWSYQGNISCKDGHDKGQKDLTEAEEIRSGRVPEKLWKEVYNIVQETMIKIIPKKKKCKKAKWLSEEPLQIAKERREAKGKGKIYPTECRVPKNSKER